MMKIMKDKMYKTLISSMLINEIKKGCYELFKRLFCENGGIKSLKNIFLELNGFIGQSYSFHESIYIA